MGGTYELVPGVSVGEFVLGDSLWHVLDVLRTKKVEYPKVEIAWDVDNPVKSAITVSLPSLQLYFPSSPHQALALISLPDIPKSSQTLSYESTVLASRSTSLTRGQVGKVLGPTYAGSTAKLAYPGITFDLEGSGGRDDIVRKVSVMPRSGDVKPLSPVASCDINPGRGVTLHLPDTLEILLGSTTAQDLLLDLGPPLRKFYKEDNRLERMWAAAESPAGSCFWNYFQYGLDFLIDSEGIIIKVICHSNIPGTPLFQRHARCPWQLTTTSTTLSHTSSLSAIQAAFSDHPETQTPAYTDEITLSVPTPEPRQSGSGGGGNGKKKKRNISPASATSSVGSEAKLGETPGAGDVKERETKEVEGAMVLDRGVEGGLDGVIGLGPSRLVGFDGLIVEEDIDSGGITSLLVYQHNTA